MSFRGPVWSSLTTSNLRGFTKDALSVKNLQLLANAAAKAAEPQKVETKPSDNSQSKKTEK